MRFSPHSAAGANSSTITATSILFKAVIAKLLKELQITDVDVAKCAADVSGAEIYLTDFMQDLHSKRYGAAIVHLGHSVSAISTSVSDCNVSRVQHKLDALAVAIRWAHINTSALDDSVRVIVGASDLWLNIGTVAKAVDSKDPDAIGRALGALIDSWSSVSRDCSGDKSCKFIDGMLRILQVTAHDVSPCQAAVSPAVISFESAATLFEQNKVSLAISQFAAGLDIMSEVAKEDSCGLTVIADAIGNSSSVLKSAVVHAEATYTSILIGSADVYAALHAAVRDLLHGDYAGTGVQLGVLLAQLRASSCKTQACTVFDGILSALSVGFADFESCKNDLDETWADLDDFARMLKKSQWNSAFGKLSSFLDGLGSSVKRCGVKKIGGAFQDLACALHKDTVAQDVGVAVQILFNGADMALDVQNMLAHIRHGQWRELGLDLSGLTDWVNGTNCDSFVCKLLEGILVDAELVLKDLSPWENALRAVENSFSAGVAAWSHGQHGEGIQYWAAALNSIAVGVHDCGLLDQLSYVAHESRVLGIGNATLLNGAGALLVHGADVYEDLYSALQDFGHHDYRAAGSKMGQVMRQCKAWTNSNLCSSNACYILNGVMQHISDVEGDARQCVGDVEGSWGEFKDAISQVVNTSSFEFAFYTDSASITAGIQDVSKGFQILADAVEKCHLQALAALLANVAAKLGLTPKIGWIEKVIHIVIDGVNVENEIADALRDWIDGNMPGFGYKVVSLLRRTPLSKALPEEPQVVV